MAESTIWLSSPHMEGHELRYVQEAYTNNQVFPMGKNVNGMEDDLKKYLDIRGVSCLSSGTAALHLALVLLGVKAGDEVICATFTFAASANPVCYQGATPVFVDSEPETWNMSPVLLREAIEDRIAKGRKPKAIILVHLYGMPGRMQELMTVANEYDIPVIEDAAEALGSRYRGQALGTFGKLGILSFNGNKIITTSGGGALVSQEEALCQKATFLATQARDPAPHYQHSEVGYNYRMSNICAGIGRGQMEVLDQRVAKRRANNAFYKKHLRDIDGLSFLTEPGSDFFSNYWLTTILLDHETSSCADRGQLREALATKHIESRPLWKPMHLQPVFADAPAYVDGTSERLFAIGLCLPSSSNITGQELNTVVEAIRKVLKGEV